MSRSIINNGRHKLQEALDKLNKWSVKWKMSFNADKCKIMHIGRSNDQAVYLMDGKRLTQTEKEKDIEVIIHKSLKPFNQCSESARKTNAVLTQIARTFHYRDKKLFCTFI